jgi:nucleoside-diphosphate-sugar epimerase
MRILITGTNSFIGANFLKISENKEVSQISLKENQPEEIDYSPFDVVLHLAAIVHQSKKISDQEYFHVNRDLCKKVAENAKKAGVKQFIFLSTVKVYGKFIPGSQPWNENSVCKPEDTYGMSKFEAEVELRGLEDNEFIVSIIRTPIVYGPGVMANMLKLIKLIERFPVLPFGNVINSRHYTYIENLIAFIDRIIEIKASGTFIVMDEKALSTTDLVEYLSKFLHRRIVLFRLPDSIIEAGVYLMPNFFDRLYRSFYLDNTKTKEILNFEAPFLTEEGLSMMISAYVENREKAKKTLKRPVFVKSVLKRE